MRYILLTLVILTYSIAQAQSDIVFSQYIETNSGSTPKGLEILNVSGTAIDLSTQNIEIHAGANGNACSLKTTIVTGTLGSGEVWVVGTSDLTSYATSNGSDLAGTTTSGTYSHNGDDAYSLYLNGVLQDMIGVCGSDPGSSWSGSGVSTANQNIGLLDGICDGDPDGWTDPSTRFETMATGTTMTGFGDAPHTCSAAAPTVEFAVTNTGILEGEASTTVALSISQAPASSVSVTVTYSAGYGDILDAGASFSENITFPGGSASNQILTVALDSEYEIACGAVETVTLEISAVSGGSATVGTEDKTVLTLNDNGGTETEIFNHDFESPGGYSTSTAEFTDGSEDYFLRTNGSDIATAVSFTNASGYFFAAQDIDGEGAASTQSVTFSGIDISDYTELAFSIAMAEDDDGSSQDWDIDDYVHITYSIDGGSDENLIWIESEPDGDNFNAVPKVDTDFDGVGDGLEITDSFQEIAAEIIGTGSTLTITITFSLDAGDEDIAVDDIVVTGETCPPNFYTYTGPDGTQAFSTATHWTPNRHTPKENDVLFIVDGTNVTLTGFSSQTIAHLGIYGEATAYLRGTSPGQTLTITDDNRDTAEFFVDTTAVFGSDATHAVNYSFGNDVNLEIFGTFAPNEGNTTIAGNTTIYENGFLTFTSGDFTNNGALSISNHGSLVQGTGSALTGTGTYALTRNKPAGQAAGLYNFWSTPVSTPVTFGDINATWQYELNAPGTLTAHWSWVDDADALQIGRGYALTGVNTTTFTGTFNNGDITVAVDRLNPTGEEFNVFGNPYPSAINALDFCNENSAVMDGYINLFNHNSSLEYTSANQQISINNMGATVAGSTDENQTLSNTYIASAQGFYTPLLDGVDEMDITFTNAMRGGDNSDFKSRNDPSASILGKFWLHLVDGNREYTTLFGVSTEASWKYDWGWDIKTEAKRNFAIHSKLSTGEHLSIQSIGPTDRTTVIPLHISVDHLGDFSIRLRPSQRMDFGQNLPYLLDTKTGTTVNLLENSYTFPAPHAAEYSERFFLVLRPKNFVTDIASKSNSKAYTLRNKADSWELQTQSSITTYWLYSYSGKLLLQADTEKEFIRLDKSEVEASGAILLLQFNDGTFTSITLQR